MVYEDLWTTTVLNFKMFPMFIQDVSNMVSNRFPCLGGWCGCLHIFSLWFPCDSAVLDKSEPPPGSVTASRWELDWGNYPQVSNFCRLVELPLLWSIRIHWTIGMWYTMIEYMYIHYLVHVSHLSHLFHLCNYNPWYSTGFAKQSWMESEDPVDVPFPIHILGLYIPF